MSLRTRGITPPSIGRLRRGSSPVLPNGTLGPEVTLSRGQLATVLYRRAGEPKVDLSVLEGIGDLDPNAFYIRAVAWATEEGVIKGYGDGFRVWP